MKSFFRLWIAVVFFSAFSGDCLFAEEKTEKVIVTGVGTSKDSAVKNAAKAAVKQVVGMYVVSDVEMQNREIIKDEVLSYSNGFIKSFKEIGMTKDDDGLIEIEAEVVVEVGKLTDKLNGLNIATKSIEVNVPEFQARVATKKEGIQDFKQMAEKVIFEPLLKSPYEIKVIRFEQIENISNVHFSDNGNPASWSKLFFLNSPTGSIRSESLKENSMFHFFLEFTVSLKDDYINSVRQFLYRFSIVMIH